MTETLTQVGYSDYYIYQLHYKNRRWIYNQYNKKAQDIITQRALLRVQLLAEGIRNGKA